MLELISGFVAGLARGTNPGPVVCVALIRVTFLAWAPSSEDRQFSGTVLVYSES